MAFILNKQKDRIEYLKVKHLFGRLDSAVDCHVEGKQVSRVHASLEWTGSSWDLCDHSRNGSWINNAPVAAGQRQSLAKGDSFGFEEHSKSLFKLNCNSEPKPLLIKGKDRVETIELDSFHVLPSEENPLVSIYLKDQLWFQEVEGRTLSLESGNVIKIAGELWEFFNPLTSELTQIAVQGQNPIDQIDFEFYPSSDLESVELIGNRAGQKLDFGVRNHHFLLLILAQCRKEDQVKGLPEHQQGWIDVNLLASKLQMDLSHLNIQVYRARKQIMSLLSGPVTPEHVVGRRSGEMRLGFSHFKVCGDSFKL